MSKVIISLCIDQETFENLEKARNLVNRSRFVEFILNNFFENGRKE